MTAEHSTMSQTGIVKLVTLLLPCAKNTPKRKTPINFWPSWAPCMKAIAAPPLICAPLKKRLVFVLLMFLQINSTSLTMPQPMPKPSIKDKPRPYTTLIHSFPLIPLRPPCKAIAAPERPAISAWLSLVGIPNHHAATAQITIANIAAQRAVRDWWGSPLKSTIL